MAYINLGQVIYPVGAIYASANSTSPASLFGGSWTQITNAALRGATNVGYTGSDECTLTTNQMPSHRHIVRYENPRKNETFPHPWEKGGGGGGFCLSGTWTSNTQDNLIAQAVGGGGSTYQHATLLQLLRLATHKLNLQGVM